MTQNITEVKEEVWNKAQKLELQCWINEPQDSDDWNAWWARKFENYTCLKNHFSNTSPISIYEVGCGPYAKNIDIIMNSLGKTFDRILLEDPLLNSYVSLNKSVSRFKSDSRVTYISEAMEKFKLSDIDISPVELVICNNVLDHVQSVEKCFVHMKDSLTSGGCLIFGQDLTSLEDVQNHPHLDDPMHPIRLDEEVLKSYLEEYNPLFFKILPREEGRNPVHHYATLLFIGTKK